MPYVSTEEKIATLRQWIAECPTERMIFFAGRGVAQECGIPDLRDPNFRDLEKYPEPLEELCSLEFYRKSKQRFYNFYFDQLMTKAKPGALHLKLAQLEEEGPLQIIITQNTDGLHKAAGSKKVIELYGNTLTSHCEYCGKEYRSYELQERSYLSHDGVPRCDCRGVIKPDMVLFGEPLDQRVMQASVWLLSRAELLVIAGASLEDASVAGFLQYFCGDKLAVINPVLKDADEKADLAIAATASEVFDY